MNSNDLLKRIDDVFAKKEINVGDLLADCRAALEAKGEPVAYISKSALNSLTTGAHASCRVWAKKDDEAVDDIPLYTAPHSLDALIAEAIEKHDDEMAYAKTVNLRTQAQPYLDALIAEIDGLDVPPVAKQKLKFITDKYRSAK